jgi:anti-anti-sigma regulatory factor
VTMKRSTVFAAGQLTGSTVDLLLGAASHLAAPDRTEIMLDLSGMTQIDPAAAQALLTAQQDWNPSKTRLRLRVPQALRRALALCDIASSPAPTACPPVAAQSHPPRQERNQRRGHAPISSVPAPRSTPPKALTSRTGPSSDKKTPGRTALPAARVRQGGTS